MPVAPNGRPRPTLPLHPEDAMSDRAKMAQFLRDKAAEFRRLGEDYDTPLSSRMREVARDLEAQAQTIESPQSGDRGRAAAVALATARARAVQNKARRERASRLAAGRLQPCEIGRA